MPTPLTHGVFGAAMGVIASKCFPELPQWQSLLVGASAAILPDIDVLFEVYRNLANRRKRHRAFSHRGITHSLFVPAAAVSILSWAGVDSHVATLAAWAYASHLLLDLFNGRDGVALLLPFTARRYRFRWQPIRNIPLSVQVVQPDRVHLLAHGLASEITWVWSVAALLAGLTFMF